MTNERLVRAAALRKTHVSAATSYRDERIECSCGAVIEAEPDPVFRDKHAPLLAAWQAHLAKRLR